MGYHNNEATTKACIEDSQRFINDRARLEHALRLTLKHIGAEYPDLIVTQVKTCDFGGLEALLAKPMYEAIPASEAWPR